MFQLDVMSRVPVYEQIVSQYEEFVLRGIFRSGDRLPSVRSLSVELAINPNTIQKAYLELDRRGLTCSVPGKGIFVSESAYEHVVAERRRQLNQLGSMAAELKLAGVSLEEVLEAICIAWKQEEKKND